MSTIPSRIFRSAEEYPDRIALRGPVAGEVCDITYRELAAEAERFGRGVLALGLAPGSRVLFLSDNRPRWILADLGLMRAGMVTVARGADVTRDEALYIADHSEAAALVVENPRLLKRLPEELAEIPIRILLEGEAEGFSSWSEVGEGGAADGEWPETDGLASIVYTSGTTGQPKGVMLSHENILHNMRTLPVVLEVTPEDRVLSILPSWHMFERAIEYVILSRGALVFYSSIRHLRRDLVKEKPTLLAGVPRLWEGMQAGVLGKLGKMSPVPRGLLRFLLRRTVAWTSHRETAAGRLLEPGDKKGAVARFGHRLAAILNAPLGLLGRRLLGSGVRNSLGGQLRAGISGGGLLPLHLDEFLAAMGVPVLVGYGLTETSPVVAIRTTRENVLGTIGKPIPETELRIVHPENGAVLSDGVVGELQVRGPQVMLGYYKNEEATAAVRTDDDWFRTGDLASLSPAGDILFRGRIKETIVLAGGENIEPSPIEARILTSPNIKQALVVGQDRKTLAALIVPERDLAESAAEAKGLSLEDFLLAEVKGLVNAKAGFKAREQIPEIRVLPEEFSVENGMLTPTMKPKRHVIVERFWEE